MNAIVPYNLGPRKCICLALSDDGATVESFSSCVFCSSARLRVSAVEIFAFPIPAMTRDVGDSGDLGLYSLRLCQ